MIRQDILTTLYIISISINAVYAIRHINDEFRVRRIIKCLTVIGITIFMAYITIYCSVFNNIVEYTVRYLEGGVYE